MSGDTGMLAPLLRKLNHYHALSNDVAPALLQLGPLSRSWPSQTRVDDRIAKGWCAVILSGFVIRQRTTRAGSDQTVALYIPGDILSFEALYTTPSDDKLRSIGSVGVAILPCDKLRELANAKPSLGRALAVSNLVDAAILREWLFNMGRHDACTRLAHLLCELATRFSAQGIGEVTSFKLPLTQEHLGDLLGLTAIHVNRSLKSLERDGWITRAGRTVSFPDIAATKHMSDFNPRYLHLAA